MFTKSFVDIRADQNRKKDKQGANKISLKSVLKVTGGQTIEMWSDIINVRSLAAVFSTTWTCLIDFRVTVQSRVLRNSPDLTDDCLCYVTEIIRKVQVFILDPSPHVHVFNVTYKLETIKDVSERLCHLD